MPPSQPVARNADSAPASYRALRIAAPQSLRSSLPGHQRAEDRARPGARLPALHRPLVAGRPRTRPPATAPDRQPPADPGTPAAPRPSDLEPGEWEIPRVPLRHERAFLAGAVVREKLRAPVAARGRAHDVVAHQQAAMPERLLAPPAAGPEHEDQEPEDGSREAFDMTALRALRESRADASRPSHARTAWPKPCPGATRHVPADPAGQRRIPDS